MKHDIEGSDLRACIDKAYDAGYNEAIRKACDWIYKNIPESDWTMVQSFKIDMKSNENS